MEDHAPAPVGTAGAGGCLAGWMAGGDETDRPWAIAPTPGLGRPGDEGDTTWPPLAGGKPPAAPTAVLPDVIPGSEVFNGDGGGGGGGVDSPTEHAITAGSNSGGASPHVQGEAARVAEAAAAAAVGAPGDWTMARVNDPRRDPAAVKADVRPFCAAPESEAVLTV